MAANGTQTPSRWQNAGNRTEGMDGVALRFPRPVILTAAIGLALAWTAVGSVPALADQVRQQQWWLGTLHVTQAQRISTGSGVTIALLDTGVDSAQPDLTGSVITGPDFTKSGEKPGQPFFGVHGTAMASLIVGHGHGADGADGVLGVAPAARLLSVRVALDDGDPLATEPGVTSGLPAAIAAGIRYAVSSGAQVIDLPLDPGQSPSALVAAPPPVPAPGTPPTAVQAAEQAAAGGSAAEQAAVNFALGKGVVLVAPAGDNGAGTDAVNFPASYPGVISVGAFDSSVTKAPFTSHQPYVTLTAAGSGMTAATPAGYATVSTTAAASAVVTGIAALIKSQYPELTPAQVSRALTSSTVFRPPGGLTDGSGHGTADAAAALKAAAVIAKPAPARAGARGRPRGRSPDAARGPVGAVHRQEPGADAAAGRADLPGRAHRAAAADRGVRAGAPAPHTGRDAGAGRPRTRRTVGLRARQREQPRG
jgi:subtilisin family serine protease